MSYIEKTRAIQVPNPDKLMGLVIGAESHLFMLEWGAQTCRIQNVGYHYGHVALTKNYREMVRLASDGIASVADCPTINRVLAHLAELVCVAMRGAPRFRNLAERYLHVVAENLLTPDQAILRLVSPETMTVAEAEENSRWLKDPIWAGIAKRADAARVAGGGAGGNVSCPPFCDDAARDHAADDRAAARWQQEAKLHRQHGRRLPPLGRIVAGI